MGRRAILLRAGMPGSLFSGATEDRKAFETRCIRVARRLFGFQNINPEYYQLVREGEIPKKLLLLVGSLVFMLFLAEGTLRLFPLLRPLPRSYVGEYDAPQRSSRWLVPDPLLGWKMRPNASEINSPGFRGLSNSHPNQACKRDCFCRCFLHLRRGSLAQKNICLTDSSRCSRQLRV